MPRARRDTDQPKSNAKPITSNWRMAMTSSVKVSSIEYRDYWRSKFEACRTRAILAQINHVYIAIDEISL